MNRKALLKQRQETVKGDVDFSLHCIKQIDSNFSVAQRTRLIKSLIPGVKILRDLVVVATADGGLMLGDMIWPLFTKADADLNAAAERLERTGVGVDNGWKDEEFCKTFLWTRIISIFLNQDDSNTLPLVIYSLSKIANRDFGDTSLQQYAVDLGTSGVTLRV
jgi:hypothetical protein